VCGTHLQRGTIGAGVRHWSAAVVQNIRDKIPAAAAYQNRGEEGQLHVQSSEGGCQRELSNSITDKFCHLRGCVGSLESEPHASHNSTQALSVMPSNVNAPFAILSKC
jgi:hypothetical protein